MFPLAFEGRGFGWLVGCMLFCLVDWVGCRVGWLADWLVGGEGPPAAVAGVAVTVSTL